MGDEFSRHKGSLWILRNLLLPIIRLQQKKYAFNSIAGGKISFTSLMKRLFKLEGEIMKNIYEHVSKLKEYLCLLKQLNNWGMIQLQSNINNAIKIRQKTSERGTLEISLCGIK